MNARPIDAEAISVELERIESAWVQLDSQARELEELQKPALMNLAMGVRLRCRSFTEAEATAMASEEYRNHLVGMVEARRKANLAKASLNRYRVWIELLRTNAATDRALMGLR